MGIYYGGHSSFSREGGSLDSASVDLSNSLRSCGSLEKDCVAASISGSGDEERLEVRVRTRPFGPWSDFVGWNRWKLFKLMIFPPVLLAVVFALFSFLIFSYGLGSYRNTFGSYCGALIFAVPMGLGLLFFVGFPAAILLNRTDFSILFSKDSVVVSCTQPYFEKVIRRGEISRIYCKEYTIKSTPFCDVCLLDSGEGTRSLVSGMRSFETAKFIERNAGRIMGIAVESAGGDD